MDYLRAGRRLSGRDIFVSDEQLQSLARKRGLEALALWAAEGLGMTHDEASAYQRDIVQAFVENTSETRLLCRIQTDIERAGKPALSTCAGMVFANAVAEATFELRGDVAKPRAKGRSMPLGRDVGAERAY